MKTEWQFPFETKDFKFEKEHTFKCKAGGSGESLDSLSLPPKLTFYFKIKPELKNETKKNNQSGWLYITLPFSLEKGKQIAQELAYLIEQKIAFEFGEFSLHRGMLITKCIPETPEEEKEIGDKRYGVEMHMVEVKEPPVFDSEKLINRAKSIDIGLVSQHNLAKKASNSIDKFLGFFKILESLFSKNQQKLKDCLKNDSDLYSIYKKTFTLNDNKKSKKSFSDFIESIVYARHRCAHLKTRKNFGYVPSDPKIKEEVECINYFSK